MSSRATPPPGPASRTLPGHARPPLPTLLALIVCAATAAGCGRRLLGHITPDAGRDSPVNDSPVRDSPVRDSPVNDGPVDDGPASDGPASDGPASDGPASDGPAPPANLPQVCTSDGWCWTHPLPTSDRFVHALGVGPDDLWLI